MANLASEIILNIFLRLPVDSILRLKCVCKEWRKLINHSNFIQLHLNKSLENNSHYPIQSLAYTDKNSLYCIDDVEFPSKLTKLNWPTIHDNKHVYIIGSCNGLVCLTTSEKCKLFIVCNPSTRTFKETISPFKDYARLFYGFGYSRLNDEYKIVVISRIFSSNRLSIWDEKIMISGSNNNYEWRKPLHTSSKDYRTRTWCNSGCGFLASNMLHWIIYRADGKRQIACFDISLETWVDELDIPDPITRKFSVMFGVFDGCLCLQVYPERYDTKKYYEFPFDIWVMKKYGVQQSWTKLFNIYEGRQQILVRSDPLCISPIVSSRDGSRILCCNRTVFWYDDEQTIEKYEVELSKWCPGSYGRAIIAFTESLVSIPGSSHVRGSMEKQGCNAKLEATKTNAGYVKQITSNEIIEI